MEQDRYELTLTEDQAKIVSRACELFSRIHMGQLEEINHELLLAETRETICGRRDQAMYLLIQLKKLYFPSLRGMGHSYGIGKSKAADTAWNIHHAIRYQMAWHKYPEGGMGVQFDPPFSWLGVDIPECVIKTEERKE